MRFLKNLKKWRKWPSFSQWKRVPAFLTKLERKILCLFSVLFIISILFLIGNLYLAWTKIGPSFGGKYIEGVIGQPRWIQPLYGVINDADRDLIELLFSGLMKYNEDGELIPDLAENIESKEGGTVFIIRLKDNVFWHDNKKLTADDVVFTINLIQNLDYQSPQRQSWLGVKVEKKVDEKTIEFRLKNFYPGFQENLTLKIMPKHIWEKIPPESFPLEIFNLRPIGTGPYKFKDLKREKSGYISSIELQRNPRYFGENGPYLSEIVFKYFQEEKEALKNLKNGQIQGFYSISPQEAKDFSDNKAFSVYRMFLPRYFALFLNSSKNKIFEQKKVRQALNYGVDKKEIIDKVILGYGKEVDSPILPEFFGFAEPKKNYEYNLETASKLLEEAGYKDENGDGFREKIVKTKKKSSKSKTSQEEITPLEFSLTTVNQTEMVKVGELLKEQLQKIGVKVTLNVSDINQLKDEIIPRRDYQALLFGQILNLTPDPFSFWHSLERKAPGLNLANYNSEKADKILEEAKKIPDQKERAKKYEEFQNILFEDSPAIFLYNPDYLYLLSKDIKGMKTIKIADPSKRFSDIENWYIKTKRRWK